MQITENKIRNIENKVIINLSHGLGNQLFQTALGLWVARGDNSRLMFDTSWYDEINESTTIREILAPKLLSFLNIPTIKIQDLNVFRPLVIDMRGMKVDSYLENITHVADQAPVHIYGAGMNYRYVSKVIQKMRTAFKKFDVNISSEDRDFFNNNFVVGIHMRLGDYLKPEIRSWIGVVDQQAQIRELKRVLANKLCSRPVKIAVFSNGKIDHEFDRQFIATEAGGEYDEVTTFKLMSNCSWLITGNSTYSIFAAYLSIDSIGASIPQKYTHKREDLSYSLISEKMKIYDNDLI